MKHLLIISLLLFTATLSANENKLLDVQVNMDDNEGKIIIFHEKEGKQNKIEESFEITDKTDVDQVIADFFKKHGIEKPPQMPSSAKLISGQQLERIDVEVIDDTAHITFKNNNNGEIEVIEEHIKIDDNVELNELIERASRKHIIEVNADSNNRVIKIDREVLKANDSDRVYYGFLAVVEDQGWQVLTIIPDSGAAQAGLQKGDLIIEVDGKKTGGDGVQLKNLTKQAKAGQKTTFKIKRDNKMKTLKITAQKRSLSDAVLPPIPPTPPSVKNIEFISIDGDRNVTPYVIMRHHKLQEWLGDNHQLIAVNAGLEFYFGTKQGVLIVNVSADNQLALAEGDVILSINGKAVTTPKQAVKALSNLNLSDGFNLEVMRKKEKISIAS